MKILIHGTCKILFAQIVDFKGFGPWDARAKTSRKQVQGRGEKQYFLVIVVDL